YSVDNREFTIEPDEQVSITVTLDANQSGVHEATMIINSNAEELEEYFVSLVGETAGPPSFGMEPAQLQDSLITGEVVEHDLVINNDGESRLLVELETVSYSEPERDANARSLRSTRDALGPRRDNAGDLLYTILHPLAANNYKSLAWDYDDNWMWIGEYMGGKRVRAFDLNGWNPNMDEQNDPPEIVAEWNNPLVNPMDCAYYDGVLYYMCLWNAYVGRCDLEGNSIGNLNVNLDGGAVNGVAIDSETGMMICVHNQQPLHLYQFDLENDGERVGQIGGNGLYAAQGNVWGRVIEFVPDHPEGPLWSGTPNRLHQMAMNMDDDLWVLGDRINNFARQATQQYDGVAHDGQNLWSTNYSSQIIQVFDDGITEFMWLSVNPDEAIIASESAMDFTVTLDATGLIGGEYEGAVLITSNDPDNSEIEFEVTMTVDDAPDIEVLWDSGYGYPDIVNWNQAFEGIYKDLQYDLIFTVISTGVTRLEVTGIQINNGAFSPDMNRFDLEPNERQDVEVLFEPTDAGEYNATLTISSNSDVHPEVEITMTAIVENAPEIVVDPDGFEEFIMLGSIVERTITVENQGDALLRFETDIDLTGEPERDNNSRSLRNINGLNSPRRDAPGDAIAQFAIPGGNHGAGIYKSGIAYNPEDELIYLTNYNRRRIDAVSFDEDYENIELDHGWVPAGNEMGAGWMNGVLYTVPWASVGLNRYDSEGNSLGMINMPTRPTACATSPENEWVMIIGDLAGWNLFVYEVDGNDVNQVGSVDWSVDGVPAQSRSCSWVDVHPDQQLWINTPNHIWNLSVDTEEWTAELVDDFGFNNGGDFWSGVGHDGHNLWFGPLQSANYFVVDDGVTELYWILLEPEEGEVSSGENNTMELTLTLITTDLVVGDYTAVINFISNDPATPEVAVDVIMHVLEAPDIDVTWEHFDEENPDLIDWSDYHQEVFAGYEYDVPININNVGDDVLSVESITTEGENFTVNPTQFGVELDNTQEVIITFDAPEPGVFEDVLTIVSNDPDEETLTFRLYASVLAVPRITVDTDQIIDELQAGSKAEHAVNIGNVGEENLRWWSLVEIRNEPGRDQNDARSLRRISKGIPERDELGELISSFSWEHSHDNNHKAGITWDRENEWMWLTCYNTDYLGAIDPANDYEEVIAWDIDPQHPMGAAWLNGVIHVLNWGRDWLGRWDADGNNLGNLNPPARATGLTSSDEYLMMITNDEDRNILILNEDGNQVGIIDNYQQYIEGNSRSIQWVNLHPDGELWLNTEGHIWQVNINSDWEATGLVNDFEWAGNQEWDGIGHDGENLWLGPYNQPEYYIVDDQIEESRWLTVIPARGIITPDGSQALTVYLDARVDYAGDYAAILHFTSNDPVDPDIVVNVQLTITGEADIVVDPELLDFGAVEHGTSAELEFTILNDGYSDLTVSDIAIEGAFFYLGDLPEEDIVVRPHTDYAVTVEFAPDELELGFFEGTVTITSDDPDEEFVEVALQGTSIYIEYPPTVINPIGDYELDEDFDPFVVADLDTVFADANHDTLDFSVQSSDTNIIVEIIDGSLLRLDSEDDWSGEAVITVIA
ncbi:MAG: choice-of-anchor D domain-containing protein, partial [Calditrichaeota bacterium]|nr:choice-of-anchor D domain-containing protein [Calditrichota bacterium]